MKFSKIEKNKSTVIFDIVNIDYIQLGILMIKDKKVLEDSSEKTTSDKLWWLIIAICGVIFLALIFWKFYTSYGALNDGVPLAPGKTPVINSDSRISPHVI